MPCCSEQTYTFTPVEMEQSCAMFGYFLLFLITCFILRALWIITSEKKGACDRRQGPVKTMVVIGSGGHTMEMLRLLSGLLPHQFSPKVYIIATTDTKSIKKVLDFENTMDERNEGRSKFEIKHIPRSREVGQSYFTSVISTMVSLLFSLLLVVKEKPDVILCNGPGTCVPICLSGFLLKVLMVKDVKLVYVESICRVKTLSLTAKMLYYFVDRLIVQWPELYEKYHRTIYLGRIV